MNKINIKYRPLGEKDIKLRVKWLKNPEVNKNLDFRVRGIGTSLEKQKEWYKKYSKNKNDKRFIIFANGQPVGIVGLIEISPIDKNGMLYIFIGEDEYRGKGIGRRASRWILDYGFNKLKLHRIWLEVNSYNQIAIKLYESLGFKEEGRLKDHIFYNGAYHDEIYMGLIKGGFYARRK